MKNMLTIAKNTFKETIRDRILYAIFAFGVLFILSTLIFGSLSLGQDIKVIKDLGLAGIYLFGIIIAIFLGTSLIYKEIEKQTLMILLSKPVSSFEIVVGKFLGLLSSIALTIILMFMVYIAVVTLKGGGFDYLALLAILLEIFEMAIFVSLTILFSSFSTPLASTIYAVLILYIGHNLDLLLKFTQKSEILLADYLARTIYYILPNLEKFNIRNLIVHQTSISTIEILLPIAYSISYCAVLLFLAHRIISKYDL